MLSPPDYTKSLDLTTDASSLWVGALTRRKTFNYETLNVERHGIKFRDKSKEVINHFLRHKGLRNYL